MVRLHNRILKQQPSIVETLDGNNLSRENKSFYMTNLQFKEVLSDATNKDFYNQFFTATRITTWLGYFGQFISSITEFLFLFIALGGTYQPFIKASNLIPILSGLLGVYIFEFLGVRVYLVRIIRQIVNKDFKGTERLILFSFNLLFVVALCGSNLFLSWLGQKYTFTQKTNITTTDKTYNLEQQRNDKVKAIELHHNEQLERLKADYRADKTEIETRYQKEIAELKNNRWTYRDNQKKYNSYTALIDKQLRAKRGDLEQLSSQFAIDKEQLIKSLKTARNDTRTTYNNRINDIAKSERANIDLWLLVQRYTLPILIGFILLSWFAIVYNEIFIKGAGQKIEIKKVEKRPFLLSVVALGIYEKIYQVFYYLVARLLGAKKYQFGAITQQIIKYDINKAFIKKTEQPKESQLVAKYRQIGFINNNRSNTADKDETGDFKNSFDYPSGSVGFYNDNRYTVTVRSEKDEQSNNNQIENISNTRTCKNCNTAFNYKHWNARYCSDNCRIESWEKRTGKKLKKKSKR